VARVWPGLLPDVPPPGMPLPRAVALAKAGTHPLAFLFALRTGVLILPVLTIILWRGVRVRTLTFIAAGLIGIAVPALYAIESPRNRGGYNFEYSLQTIYAHWAAVGALVLLVIVVVRTLARAKAAAPTAEPPPRDPGDGAPGDPAGLYARHAP
jgi:hypothetical protein